MLIEPLTKQTPLPLLEVVQVHNFDDNENSDETESNREQEQPLIVPLHGSTDVESPPLLVAATTEASNRSDHEELLFIRPSDKDTCSGSGNAEKHVTDDEGSNAKEKEAHRLLREIMNGNATRNDQIRILPDLIRVIITTAVTTTAISEDDSNSNILTLLHQLRDWIYRISRSQMNADLLPGCLRALELVLFLPDGADEGPQEPDFNVFRAAAAVYSNDNDDDDDDKNYDEESSQELVDLVLLLPGLVANATGRSSRSTMNGCVLPTWCRSRRLFAVRLLQSASAAATSMQVLGQLVASLARRQGGMPIAKFIHTQLLTMTATPTEQESQTVDCFVERLGTVFRSLVPRETADILVCLLLRLTRDHHSTNMVTTAVDPLIRSSISRDPFVAEAIVKEAILSTTVSLRLLGPESSRIFVERIAQLLHEVETKPFLDDDDDDEEEEADNEYLEADTLLQWQTLVVARVWSLSSTVSDVAVEYQSHISCFLTKALSILKIDDALSEIVTVCLEGVTIRLESTISSVRLDGMRVAVELAQSLGQKLEFDELKEAEGKAKNAGLIEVDNQSLGGKDVGLAKVSDINDDPDWDSDLDDDDDLEAYHLDSDEEDLCEVPKPRYLTDCLELLRVPESDDLAHQSHRVALESLSTVIRSVPIDMVDVGPSVARQLLRMENKFSVDNFRELVMNSLCQLVVYNPESVGSTLVEEIFREGSLQNRQNGFWALTDAAFELSGLKHLRHLQEEQSKRKLDRSISAVSGKRSLVESRSADFLVVKENDDQTRRWGGSKSSSSRTSYRNLLVTVAPTWFYGLMQRFIESREETSLWGGTVGASLLSGLLTTLSALVECCGIQPGNSLLARDLVQLAWTFRGSEVVALRRASLFAVGTGLEWTHDENALTSLLMDENLGIAHGLLEVKVHDKDDGCRDLASTIASAVSTNLSSIEKAKPLLSPISSNEIQL